MKIVKEFVENYLYYYNELLKNKHELINHTLTMKVGKTTMVVSKDAIIALADFYSKYSEDETIVLK